VNKESSKQLYCQLLSRCCKELSSVQIKSLPDRMRAIIEPRYEAYHEKLRMCVPPPLLCLRHVPCFDDIAREWLFDGQLYREYSYQKLSLSVDNVGDFFPRHSVVSVQLQASLQCVSVE